MPSSAIARRPRLSPDQMLDRILNDPLKNLTDLVCVLEGEYDVLTKRVAQSIKKISAEERYKVWVTLNPKSVSSPTEKDLAAALIAYLDSVCKKVAAQGGKPFTTPKYKRLRTVMGSFFVNFQQPRVDPTWAKLQAFAPVVCKGIEKCSVAAMQSFMTLYLASRPMIAKGMQKIGEMDVEMVKECLANSETCGKVAKVICGLLHGLDSTKYSPTVWLLISSLKMGCASFIGQESCDPIRMKDRHEFADLVVPHFSNDEKSKFLTFLGMGPYFSPNDPRRLKDKVMPKIKNLMEQIKKAMAMVRPSSAKK